MSQRLRWKIAAAVNRLPGQCWSDLVQWALGWGGRESRLPWAPITVVCRNDASRTGSCYCSKIRVRTLDEYADEAIAVTREQP